MKNTVAFTLVELMVVIAIISILAVGSIRGYDSYLEKAKENTRIQIAVRLVNDFSILALEGRVDEALDKIGEGCILAPDEVIDDDCTTHGNSAADWIEDVSSVFPSVANATYPYLKNPNGDKEFGIYIRDNGGYDDIWVSFGFAFEDSCEKSGIIEKLSGLEIPGFDNYNFSSMQSYGENYACSFISCGDPAC